MSANKRTRQEVIFRRVAADLNEGQDAGDVHIRLLQTDVSDFNEYFGCESRPSNENLAGFANTRKHLRTLALMQNSSAIMSQKNRDEAVVSFFRTLESNRGQCCEFLTELGLYGQNLGPTGAEVFATKMKLFTSLTNLDLGRNNLQDRGLSVISPHLSDMPRLSQLLLDDNGFGDVGALTLTQNTPTTLAILSVRENTFSEQGIEAFANWVQQIKGGILSVLLGIDLGSVAMKIPGLPREAVGWDNLKILEHMRVSRVRKAAGGARQDPFDVVISELALRLSSPLKIDLTSTNIGAERLETFCSALRGTLRPISTVSLRQDVNRIKGAVILKGTPLGSVGFNSIIHSLLANQKLKSKFLVCLDLFGQDIGPEGARGLATAVCRLSSLTALDLESNFILPDGMEALARSAAHISSLTTLNLAANKLTKHGATNFTPMFRHLPNLTMLNLSQNQLASGICDLALALPLLTSLTALDITKNNIDGGSEEELCGALVRMRAGRIAVLEGVSLSDSKIIQSLNTRESSNMKILNFIRERDIKK